MRDDKMKEWSRDEVSIFHGYSGDVSSFFINHHMKFSKWLESYQGNITVFDVGCCSGFVLNSIGGMVQTYQGVDLSPLSIENARRIFVDPRFSFEVFDVEDLSFDMSKINCEICYIDSVLTMLEDPQTFLKNALKNFNVVYLNRTRYDFDTTEKLENQWAGMQRASTWWQFDKSFFQNLADELSMKVDFKTEEVNSIIFTRSNE
jgi:hypothetical protein